MKYLSFRFDVDTHKCILEGVPRLLTLAKRHNVKFTFYICFGRSIDPLSFFQNKLKSEKVATPHKNLSALTKLGLKDYLIAAAINPQIGWVGRDIIRQCIAEGHEIGLHGGRNHELWNQHAYSWKLSEIQSEIEWGQQALKKIAPQYKMMGFASPHWKGNRRIFGVLAKNGFSYVSDIHTDKPLQSIARRGSVLPNIPVNISGEPGGVGYLEWCRANGFSDKQLADHFEKMLLRRKKWAIVYDHPYYSGVKELAMLEKMIVMGKKQGFRIVPVSTIYKKQ